MIMEAERIEVGVFDKVGILTLNNPPANALSPKVREEFATKLSAMAQDDSIWTLILMGAGEKFFAAGADIPSLLKLDPESGLERVQKSRRFFTAVASVEKPVIAAINGICFGAGLELALVCDIRIAAEHVRLGLPEVGLGLIPGAGGTQRLPRTVGPGWANYLLFTGEAITADKALGIGLVQEVVSSEPLRNAAIRIAEKINAKGPLAVRAAKKAASKGLQYPLEKGLDFENEVFSEICGTQDKNEGIRAFLEKRAPRFTGR
jgi:enoyl-CoA hydratase